MMWYGDITRSSGQVEKHPARHSDVKKTKRLTERKCGRITFVYEQVCSVLLQRTEINGG